METDAKTEQKTARNRAKNGTKTAQKTIENGAKTAQKTDGNGAENGAETARETDENRAGNETGEERGTARETRRESEGNEHVYGSFCGEGCPYCGEPRRALLSADSAPSDLRWAGVRVYAALCDRRGPALDLLVAPARPGAGPTIADSVRVSFCPVCGRSL